MLLPPRWPSWPCLPLRGVRRRRAPRCRAIEGLSAPRVAGAAMHPRLAVYLRGGGPVSAASSQPLGIPRRLAGGGLLRERRLALGGSWRRPACGCCSRPLGRISGSVQRLVPAALPHTRTADLCRPLGLGVLSAAPPWPIRPAAAPPLAALGRSFEVAHWALSPWVELRGGRGLNQQRGGVVVVSNR